MRRINRIPDPTPYLQIDAEEQARLRDREIDFDVKTFTPDEIKSFEEQERKLRELQWAVHEQSEFCFKHFGFFPSIYRYDVSLDRMLVIPLGVENWVKNWRKENERFKTN